MITSLAAMWTLLAVCTQTPTSPNSPTSPTSPASPANPPATPQRAITNTYHGTDVVDHYQWLEDWNNPEVKAWSEAQNTYARSILDSLPGVAKLRGELTEIYTAQSESYSGLAYGGSKLFAIKRQPPKQQPFLVILEGGINEPQRERILVDPNSIDPAGLTSIDWFEPSPDGSLIAVSISEGGSESGDVHVYEIATGTERTADRVPRVNGGTAGGSLAWNKDGTGFFYSRYPREGERPAADMDFYTLVYYHTLGTATEKDTYELGKALPASSSPNTEVKTGATFEYGRTSPFEFTRIAEILVASHHDTGRVLCTVQHGDGGYFALYLRDEKAQWHVIADYNQRAVQAAFGPAGSLFIISRENALKGKVLFLPADQVAKGITAAKEIIPEGTDSIVTDFFDPSTFRVSPNTLIVTYQLGGPSELRIFDHYGKRAASPKQLPIASVSGACITPDGQLLFNAVSYIEPAAWYLFNQSARTTTKTPLAIKAPVSFDDCEVIREFATSKDGTKVPVNIIRKKSITLDGSNPCLLTGYGGYGVNIEPAFRPALRVMLDRGFVWAQANIRGGGEYGEAWHRAGALTNKQNCFDDFAAACQHLISTKHTSAARLAIEGGSNGGLLMGALLTQHPTLIKAIVSHVGIYDMLRVELSANGAFNIPEFGTVKDEAQFKALLAYSPYHNVKTATAYPSILFLTGANDPRVDPMQSRKMTARLQEVGAQALLRTSASSGHGSGTSLSERIEQAVDVNAFLCEKLGVKVE